jgi:hypothetical protein
VASEAFTRTADNHTFTVRVGRPGIDRSHGFYVIERRHDGYTFASTGTAERVIAGPYLRGYEALAVAQRETDSR